MPLNDSERPHGDGRPGPAGDPAASPVGTVAEEAAKLVEMLAATRGPWTGTGPGATSASSRGASGQGPEAGPADHAHGTAGPAGASTPAGHTCTCGGTTPQACRLCPVCQVIAFVSSISPETIDRAADLVGFAATALRDLATAQRERQQAPDAAPRPEEDLP